MVQQVIGIGAAPNDNTGDKDRTAWDKVNDMFAELYPGTYTPATSYFAFGTNIRGVTRESVDLDNITRSGFYYSPSATANSPGVDGFVMHIGYDVDTTAGAQLHLDFSNVLRTRTRNASTWTSWVVK